MTYRLGLIVNPVAGMGGAVGLKGTDGERHAEALARGAKPVAADRAARALAMLRRLSGDFRLLTCAAGMGESAARAAGIPPEIVYTGTRGTGRDTTAAARECIRRGVDLLLVAGGDGTARDVLAANCDAQPVLGIPAGVKMHSAVFAATPAAAGDVAASWLAAGCRRSALVSAEVLDRDEDEASPRLHGTLSVPATAAWTPHPKAGGTGGAMLDGACAFAAKLARDDRVTLLGPGATMRRIKERLGFPGTLLGVDAVRGGRLLATDLGEREILGLLDGRQGRIILSVVGGQGFLFGRGNQPFSPAVIRAIGRDAIVVIAGLDKLAALGGRPLFVDTGDESLDRELAGYVNVRTGATRSVTSRVAATPGDVAGAGVAGRQGA